MNSGPAQYGFYAVIDDLTRELDSLNSVDTRYALLLSDYYNVDIYVIIDRELRILNSRNAILATITIPQFKDLEIYVHQVILMDKHQVDQLWFSFMLMVVILKLLEK